MDGRWPVKEPIAAYVILAFLVGMLVSVILAVFGALPREYARGVKDHATGKAAYVWIQLPDGTNEERVVRKSDGIDRDRIGAGVFKSMADAEREGQALADTPEATQ